MSSDELTNYENTFFDMLWETFLEENELHQDWAKHVYEAHEEYKQGQADMVHDQMKERDIE